MSFVHKDEVVALEGVYGDGLLAHLLLELGDLQDLDGLSGEEATSVFLEDLRLDTGLLELA